jgi:putative ABC transport system permease protein
MDRILFNFFLALDGVAANKLRAFLTALGIVFGVAAVITMMAIGSGAKESILEQMKLIGTNNIIINAGAEDEGEEASSEETAATNTASAGKTTVPWSPGLQTSDIDAIVYALPGVTKVSSEIVIQTQSIYNGKLRKVKCVGTTNDFFDLNNLKIGQGSFFHPIHEKNGEAVCIIGKNIQSYFFPKEDPIGQLIKCGSVWMRVIGVLDRRIASSNSLETLGIRDYNDDVFIPLHTALIRYDNKATIKKKHIGRARNDEPLRNYHQIDKAVIQLEDSKQLLAASEVISRILKRRHNDLVDYEIEVPELLLQQQQKTQETFNLVLAVIAGISLLVGGIGIMNIMLASVLERVKEIGVRRSMGAFRSDIVLQFLFEAVFISLLGGITGIVLGVLGARIIASYAEIPTVISSLSILISFGVAATIGLIFGIVPARRAAQMDPIKALRSD